MSKNTSSESNVIGRNKVKIFATLLAIFATMGLAAFLARPSQSKSLYAPEDDSTLDEYDFNPAV